MTPCAPRNWSRKRRVRGVALLALAFAASWASSGWWFAGVLGVIVVVAMDALAELILGFLDRPNLRVTVKEVNRGDSGVVLAGDTVRLEMTLTTNRPPLRPRFVTPVLPAGIEPSAEGGALVEPHDLRGAPAVLGFELLAAHAGTHVLPGVMLRNSSPLGLFSRARAVPAPVTLQVLPDFMATRDPALARHFRRALRTERASARRVRGGGGEFHELRGYRFADPYHRIDWKATARRNTLLVREFEEPVAISMDVVLDASLDMTHDSNERSRFHAAATLVTRLACAAVARQLTFRVTAYDETVVLDTETSGSGSGTLRLAAQVADLSRQAVLRRARAVLSSPSSHPRLLARLERARRWWRPSAPPLGSARSLPTGSPDRSIRVEDEAQFASDVAAASLRDAAIPCAGCGLRIFPGDPGCPRCGLAFGKDGLPPRASTLETILGADPRRTRGPGLLFVISSLRGGEACDRVAERLVHIAASGRVVHVVAPGLHGVDDTPAASSGPLGQYPERAQILADIDRVGQLLRIRAFSRRLQEAGVHWHEIDDGSDLEKLVSDALLCPV